MEIWISILGLGATVLSAVIASAILYGKLQQRVLVTERDVAAHNAWKESIVLQVAQVGQLHGDMGRVAEELRAIKTALADLRVSMGRLEGYQDAQREKDRIQRRDTLQP